MSATEDELEGMVGATIGQKYKLTRLLGRGGMGAVYEATNQWTERRVALKLMLASKAQHADLVERFLREARAASRLQHNHIVQVLDVGQHEDGSFYLIQEFLTGGDLRTLLDERERISPDETRQLLAPVLSALSLAHSQGVVHRDLKPDNLFVCTTDQGPLVKVIDFGIAKLTETRPESLSVTRTGTAIGTPLYMSPEQARGERAVDAQTDIWSMGVVLFECIAGECPFLGESYNEVLAKILTQRAPRLDVLFASVPSSVADVVYRALDPDRTRRFATMQAFAEAVLSCDGFASKSLAIAHSSAPVSESVKRDRHAETLVAGAPSKAATDAHAHTIEVVPERPSAVEVAPPLPSAELAPAVLPAAPLQAAAVPVVQSVQSADTTSALTAIAQPASKPPTAMVAVAGVLALVVMGVGFGVTRQPPAQTQQTREIVRTVQQTVLAPSPRQPFSVALSTSPPNAAIEIDGRAVGMGAFAGNFLADGASHTLRVSAPGYLTETVSFRDAPPPPRVELRRDPSAVGTARVLPRTTTTTPPAAHTPQTPRGPMQREYE
ncbi:MAG: protein kinase [Deltaproteobacteria bacterium]|nr:protein kinase [Deltaproteobacteria bacterium]